MMNKPCEEICVYNQQIYVREIERITNRPERNNKAEWRKYRQNAQWNDLGHRNAMQRGGKHVVDVHE